MARTNLALRAVSKLLFQSSSQKTTLVQGVVFDEKFDFIAMKFQMAVRVRFDLLSQSISYETFVPSAERRTRPLMVIVRNLTSGINSLEELVWTGEAFIKVEGISQDINTTI